MLWLIVICKNILKIHFNNDMVEVQIWVPLKNSMMWFSPNYLLPLPHNVFSPNYWKTNLYNSLLKDFSSILIRSALEVMSSRSFYMLVFIIFLLFKKKKKFHPFTITIFLIIVIFIISISPSPIMFYVMNLPAMLKSPHNFLSLELNWIKILKTWIFHIYTKKYCDRCKHDKGAKITSLVTVYSWNISI